MKKWLLLISILAALVLLWQTDFIKAARNSDTAFFTETLFSQWGMFLPLVTIPLLVIQNIFTLFPVLIIIIVHNLAFGFAGGALISFTGTLAGALACFYLVRYFNVGFIRKIQEKHEQKFERYYRWISRYGVMMIILLRSIPVFPSNIISAAAAFTPIRSGAYFWSCVFGNLSMVWLLSLLSAPVWAGEEHASLVSWLFAGYVLYCAGLLVFFIRQEVERRKIRTVRRADVS
ncbi:TVP38/TMEM64 family protein [Alteribacter natronophilus]|uniref:TVP38/TMEM64 family protein n=1 Tax=Alteribacter natronophilus TaxID=2583810 RepID=UPI00110F6464|nr:VTT domain-containing protein [Alteribacter natronophilus]TMW73343.1 TVP38/TMEM64 family protein [Alteribacter natronophilus]